MLARVGQAARPDGDQAIGVRVGQRPHQHRVHDCEHGDVDGDAKREDRHDRQATRVSERPEALAKRLRQLEHRVSPSERR
jgi:hypothetical protein